MRTITANAQALLSQNMGTEIMVVLEVEWSDGGSVYYSDQDLSGAEPKIIDMGGFDTSMILEGSSDSQELDIVLDDTDGSIRAIYQSIDTHKRPARVYLLHKGLTLVDKILVFKGEVVTPIEWDETQRSVKFNILSRLDATQVGFSMEEGDFPNIPDEALGKAWPLVFGQVCHLPAVKVRAPRRGYLESGLGISDFTLPERICQAVKIQCPSQSTGTHTYFVNVGDGWTSTTEKTIGPDLECVNRRFGEICRLKDLLEQQTAYERSTVEINNGVSFPQGEQVTLFVDNALFTGVFTGNTFNITSCQHPEFASFNHQLCVNVPGLGYGTVNGNAQIGGSTSVEQGAGGYWAISGNASGNGTSTWVPSGNNTSFIADQNEAQAFASCDAALQGTPGMVGGPKESWALYDSMEESDFFWAPAGTEVYIEAESEILYVVSLLPGTVDGVAAYRRAPNGFRYLTEVPADRYTVYETDYDGYTVAEIGMDKALALYIDDATGKSEGWEDQIYVSFTSSVGPDPTAIIQWLVEKYTDLTVDATSFAAVSAYMTNYPNNFYLTDRLDVFDLIQDIAYQSRCSVYVRNDVVYMTYLSVEPSSLRTLSESDILSGTFVEALSETEDVYTTHNVAWKKAGAAVRADQSVDRKVILKYNVKKYGTVEEEWDYYTYNLYELILKSATFWLIRKANSWKRVSFQLPIKHIDLDVGDCVTLNLAQFGDPVKIVIEKMNLNPSDHTLDVECWTPIRSGETSQFYWAWPSQQAAAAVWPLADDTAGGAGYNFNVTPPVGHILLGGAHRDDQLIITTGDLHPSDLDDTLPTVDCELSDYINFNETPPEIIAKQIAQSAARSDMENNMTGGGNPGGQEDEKQTGDCGSYPYGCGCSYKAEVIYHKSAKQGRADASGEPASDTNCGGPCTDSPGCPTCFGTTWTVCHTFSTTWAATSFKSYTLSNQGKSINSYWQKDEVGVLDVRLSEGNHVPCAGDPSQYCPPLTEVTPPEDGQTGGGETLAPTGETGDEP
jgi:hypothetical protein